MSARKANLEFVIRETELGTSSFLQLEIKSHPVKSESSFQGHARLEWERTRPWRRQA